MIPKDMRNYKILRVAGLHYRNAMLTLYKKNPGLRLQPYAEQKNALFRAGYVYSDSFARGMRALGHEAHEIVYDVEPLQKAWAREKGIKYNPGYWQCDILLTQLKNLKPEIVYFQDMDFLPLSICRNLKRDFPFLKLLVMYRGCPIITPDIIRKLSTADVLLAGVPILVEKYRKEGLKSHLVYHSFDEDILEKIGAGNSIENNPKYDFTFLGSSGFAKGIFYSGRYWALVELIQKINLEAWVEDTHEPIARRPAKAPLKSRIRKTLKKLSKYYNPKTLDKICASRLMPNKVRRAIREAAGEKQDLLKRFNAKQGLPVEPLCGLFPRRCHRPVFGVEMYKVLRQSRVTFTMHADVVENNVGSMRMFEATGVGSCLLTDRGKNLHDLFEEGREVVAYSSTEECIDKAKYLLENEKARRQIAIAGQKRILKDHTVAHRCREIDGILQRML